MTTREKLIGKQYPIKDINGNEYLSNPIFNAWDCESVAGYFVTFEKDATIGVVIGYGLANRITEE